MGEGGVEEGRGGTLEVTPRFCPYFPSPAPNTSTRGPPEGLPVLAAALTGSSRGPPGPGCASHGVLQRASRSWLRLSRGPPQGLPVLAAPHTGSSRGPPGPGCASHGVLQRASRSWLRLTLALSSSQPEGVFCEIQSKLGNNTKCLAK